MRIFIYGTGNYALNFFCYVPKMMDDISGFVETKKSKNSFLGKPIYEVDEAFDYDLIIVASKFVYEIKAELYRNGIDLCKVIFLAKTWISVKLGGQISYDFLKCKNEPDESYVFFDLNGVYTTSEEVADYYAKDETPEVIWNRISQYEVGVHATHLAAQQREMLENKFLPLLSQKDNICDIGCASGEWSRLLSFYVKHIDAFDISYPMINTGKKLNDEYGFSNIDYSCTDIVETKMRSMYDNGLMLGVGIYHGAEIFRTVVQNVAQHIKKGGYLAVRDTVTMYTDRNIFLARKGMDHIFGNYRANYLPIRVYENIFKSCGFEIVEENYFSPYFHEPMELGSHGWIFKKC